MASLRDGRTDAGSFNAIGDTCGSGSSIGSGESSGGISIASGINASSLIAIVVVVVFMFLVIVQGKGFSEMLTTLITLAGTHVASLVLGGTAAAGVEAALPFLTYFSKARKAVAMARMVSRLVHGRDLNEMEVKRISLDPTLTK